MRTLFIGPTRLGDAILVSGLVDRLHRDDPRGTLTIACGAQAAMALALAPGLSTLHVVHKQKWSRHWLSLWRATKGVRWDRVVDLRRSLLPWALRAGERRVIPRSLPSEHRVTLASRTLGLPPQAPRIWIDGKHARAAGDMAGKSSRMVAIAPGANWICKTWPIGRFTQLAHALVGRGGALDGATIVLVGGAEEREGARPLWQAFPADRVVQAFGADVPTTAALLARCSLFVGNDSAMMHLAAAVGIPTVGLFGPTRDEHYGPWGGHGLVVRTPETVDSLLATRRSGEPDRTLLGSLTVEAVLKAITDRWPDLGPARITEREDETIRIASDA